MKLLVWLWCATLAMLALVLPGRLAHDAETPRAEAAFTSHQIWDSDNGSTIQSLGLPQQAIFTITREGVARAPFDTLEARGYGMAAISADGALIAFSQIGERTGSGDPPATLRVVVCSPEGRIIASFPRAGRFQWHPQRRWLAFIDEHIDPGDWKLVAERVGVWRAENGSTRFYPQRPDQIGWGRGDRLFLEFEQKVDALSLSTGKVTATHHHGADVSPDERYSLRIDRRTSWPSVLDDRDSILISGCIPERLGLSPYADLAIWWMGGGFRPFWARGEGMDHVLCVANGPPPPPTGLFPTRSTPGQKGWFTALIDMRTLKVVDIIPGKPVARTGTGTGVVILRADSLGLAWFKRMVPQTLPSDSARVRVEMVMWGSWGKPSRHSLGSLERDVVAGDWLPVRGVSTSCGSPFRVIEVRSRSSVLIGFRKGSMVGRDSTVLVSNDPIRLSTNSLDGGYEYTLSVVTRQ